MHGIIATWRMAKEGIELGEELLKNREKSGRAIETAIRAVEDFPYYKSVGYGGLPNEEQIVELDAVNALLDADQIVIAAGGGGIPVMEQDNHLKGASAVIEKDLAAGKLAEGINADMLIILTNVEKVCINLGQDNEEPLGELTTDQARAYMEEGHFGIGLHICRVAAGKHGGGLSVANGMDGGAFVSVSFFCGKS